MLKLHAPVFPEEHTGNRAILANTGRAPHKRLIDPFFHQRADCGKTVCTERTRRAEHRTDQTLRTTDELKSECERNIQHFRDHSLFQIGHPDISGNRADCRFGKRRDNLAERINRNRGIAVDRHGNIAGRNLDRFIKRPAFASVADQIFGDDPARKLLGGLADPVPCIIFGTVVHSNDFQLVRRIIALQHTAECSRDVFPFVIGGNYHGAFRQLGIVQRRCLLVKPGKNPLKQKIPQRDAGDGQPEHQQHKTESVDNERTDIHRKQHVKRSRQRQSGDNPCDHFQSPYSVCVHKPEILSLICSCSSFIF